jgi:signal peptidase
MAKRAKKRDRADKDSERVDPRSKTRERDKIASDDGGEMRSADGAQEKRGKKVKRGWFRRKREDKEEEYKEEDEEKGDKDKEVQKEGEEDEEEKVKYSTLMWIGIILLFLGILFLIILGLWMGNQQFGLIGLVCVLVGIPLFVMEYLKMETVGRKSVRRSALLLGRDVAIAFLIVGIIMGAIMAYYQIWPPMVVIESESMQHSDSESFIGTIDTGDLVLVRKAPAKSDVVTYVEGRARGYDTYGDYGDVIVFRKDGAPPPATPIIHRPIIYLEWNHTTNYSYDVPGLEGLEINKDWGAVDKHGNQVTSYYNLTGYMWISDVGYTKKNMTILLQTYLSTSGLHGLDIYLTAGDHNLETSASPDPWTVRQEWIIGVARGELPWFGLIKLTLNAEGKCCSRGWGDPAAPKNSWDSLLITLILIIAIPIALDFVIGFVSDIRSKKKGKEGKKEKGKGKDSEKKREKPRKKKIGKKLSRLEKEKMAKRKN